MYVHSMRLNAIRAKQIIKDVKYFEWLGIEQTTELNASTTTKIPYVRMRTNIIMANAQ